MADPAWSRALPFDVVAGLGLAVFLASLALPWETVRSCPIFEECGPWEERMGWEVFGAQSSFAVAASLMLYAAVPHASLRRLLPACAIAVVGILLQVYADWAGFVIFGDAEVHHDALALAAVGLGVAFACSCLGGLLARSATRPQAPASA